MVSGLRQDSLDRELPHGGLNIGQAREPVKLHLAKVFTITVLFVRLLAQVERLTSCRVKAKAVTLPVCLSYIGIALYMLKIVIVFNLTRLSHYIQVVGTA